MLFVTLRKRTVPHACISAIKLGKLKDEIEEISLGSTTQRLAELDQRRLIKLHEKVADAAALIECYHLALHHYHCMVCYGLSCNHYPFIMQS